MNFLMVTFMSMIFVKQIKVRFLFCLIGISFSIPYFAQPLNKYWVHRERLKNFMVSTVNPGGSIPTGKREFIQGSLNGSITHPGLAWNDAGWEIGYWIGTLAMEYKLLSENGEDLTQTREDLYNALHAIGRLDQSAEEVWDCNSSIPPKNGFILRDDVPSDFVNYADQLNEGLVPPVNGFRIKCISSAFTDYLGGECEASHDHWTGIFIGLTLVKKFVPEWENYFNIPFYDLETTFVGEVRKLSNRYIFWLASHNWLLFNPCEGRVVKGRYNTATVDFLCAYTAENYCAEEFNFNNNVTPFSSGPISFELVDFSSYLFDVLQGNIKLCVDDGGAFAFPQALGLAKLNEFIQEGTPEVIPATAMYLNLMAFAFPTPPNYGLSFPNPLCPGYVSPQFFLDPLVFPYRDAWNIAFYASISKKEPLFGTLAALSNLSPINLGLPMSQEFLSNYLIQQGSEHKLDYLILLNNLIHGASISNGNPITFTDEYFECLLNSSPCRGFNGANQGTPSREWGCGDDRLKGDINCTSDGFGWDESAFTGLNYLFIHNLFALSNPTLASQFEIIPIKQLSKDTILLQNYHEYDRKNFYANSLITVGSTQSNPDYVIGVDPIDGDIGRVTFAVAPGGIIQFNDGFNIVGGAFMETLEDQEIQPWDCSYPSDVICNPISTNRLAVNKELLKNEIQFPSKRKPEEILEAQFTVFPNPAKEFTELYYSSSGASTFSISIINSLGREVFYQNEISDGMKKTTVHLPLNDFYSGVYIVNLRIKSNNNNETFQTKKLVVLK